MENQVISDVLFILIALLVAAFLGWFIGYLMGKNRCKKQIEEVKQENEALKKTIHERDVEINRLKLQLTESARPAQSTAPSSKANYPDFVAKEAKEKMGRAIRKDDLTLIKGIGPAISKVLKSSGITDWASLSQAKEDQLQTMLDEAGREKFSLHNPATWPQQADFAANAKWSELKGLQDKI